MTEQTGSSVWLQDLFLHGAHGEKALRMLLSREAAEKKERLVSLSLIGRGLGFCAGMRLFRERTGFGHGCPYVTGAHGCAK